MTGRRADVGRSVGIVWTALDAVVTVVAVACDGGGGKAQDVTASPGTRSGSSAVATVAVPSITGTVPLPTTAPNSSGPRPTPKRLNVGPDRPCGAGVWAPAVYDHVVWIWMENHRRSQVLGPAAPYMTTLAASCGSASDYRQVGSPSLPNYVGATSGDTWGIGDDAGPAAHPLAVDNLFRQVRESGRRAVTYAEAMGSPCALVGQGQFAARHVPAAYYTGADDREACGNDVVPLGTTEAGAWHDAVARDALPAFAFVVPDLCHSTHDCAVGVGDAWLASWLPGLLAGGSYAAGTTAVFVVWDEPTPMPFVAVAPSVPAGIATADPVDHYALLRTTEEMLGITAYLGRAAAAPSLRSPLGL